MPETKPKAFISYSWSSPDHCDQIRSYAERLVNDGVDIVLDQWNLSEGQDKYAFMEKMVTDPTVTHVIIFSDQMYAQKADARKAGVGTESQIISKEVYDKVDQTKFLPVVCEKQDDDEPHLPIFLAGRIWIDFSSDELVNENWEQLIRALYGQPMYEKPELGAPPSYLSAEQNRPSLPTVGKFNTLRTALLNSKPGVPLHRQDFLKAAIAFADSLRVRKAPEVEHFDDKVLADLHALKPLRDQLIEWLQLEIMITESSQLESLLIEFLESILALKFRPPELTSFHEMWFDAHGIFVYELFLYVIAILVKCDRPELIRQLFTNHYILPDTEMQQGRDFVGFDEFCAYSDALVSRNKRLKLNRASLLADLIKDRADRVELPFPDLMQAEAILLLYAMLATQKHQWYPHTLIYSSSQRFPFFLRAAQHKYFLRLATITGIASADEMRARFKTAIESDWADLAKSFRFRRGINLLSGMNMDNLDTIP